MSLETNISLLGPVHDVAKLMTLNLVTRVVASEGQNLRAVFDMGRLGRELFVYSLAYATFYGAIIPGWKMGIVPLYENFLTQ